VRPGYELCHNCGGMGLIIVDQRTHPPKTRNCVVCGGAGVLPVPR
jgi:DnaJ-class molecular chaperone